MKKTNLLKSGLIVMIITTLGSVLNYVSQLLMAKYFSIENYGMINTIFSLILIVSVVGNTGFMIMSKNLSNEKIIDKYNCYKIIFTKLNKFIVLLSFIFILCYPLLGNLIAKNFLIILLTILVLISSIYPIIYQGVFGALNKFLQLGLYTLIVPLIKIITVLYTSFYLRKYEIETVLISIIIGNLLSIIIGHIFSYKKLIKKAENEISINNLEYRNIFIINILVSFLMNVDILYLSYYTSSKTIGLYSSVLMFGKIIYYFVTALVTVMLPLISRKSNDDKNSRSVFYQTVFFTLILTICFLIPINLFPKQILHVVFGTKFDSAIVYMKYSSIICLSYSLNYLLINYLIGINKNKKPKNVLLVSSIFICLLILIFKKNIKLVLMLIAGCNLLAFIVNFIFLKKGANDFTKPKIITTLSNKKLSIITPCYNEGKNIYKNLLKMSKIISKFSNNFEIICVNDGSIDNSKSEIEKACRKDKKIIMKSYAKNKGKGNALKIGTNEATGDLIAFIDSDLELPPIYILKYIKIMEEENVDVVIGSKLHEESKLKYPLNRKIFSYGYYCFLKILFNLKIKDTQTGLKLFKSNVIKKVMPIIETDGFAFDIEVLSIINRLGYKMIDAPIELDFTREHAMGRIKINDITKMITDTFKIFFKLRLKKYYDKKIKQKMQKNKNIFFFIGTEAELMKMYHVISEADKRGYKTFIVSNAQNDISHSKYLTIINKKIDIDLTKYAPTKKGMKEYIKWFIKTRAYGIKKFKKIKRMYDFKNSLMVVHGDTMSTLMGSMISRKVGLRYAHVESGPRSFNWFSPFPEEIDRYFSSKKSVLNFCQSTEATEYAKKFFKAPAINTHFNTGIEILFDALDECKVKKLKGPLKEKYFVFAIHRQENLLNKDFMQNTVKEVCKLSQKMKCLFIYHDQTKETLEKFKLWDKIKNNKNFEIVGRQEYVDFINIIQHSEFVIGDGCGNQQEFYYMGKPYLIMRTEVEEKTEGLGWNAKPFESDFSNIVKFYEEYVNYKHDIIEMKEKPSQIIMNEIDRWYKNG